MLRAAMSVRPYTIYTGAPLCQSLDYLYIASLCPGSEGVVREAKSYDEMGPAEPFFIPLSIVSDQNLSRARAGIDDPRFHGVYLLDRLGPREREEISKGRAFVLIDYSGEAALLDEVVWTDFHRELSTMKLGPEQFVIINENHGFVREYQVWARRQDLTPIHVVSYNHGLFALSALLNANEAHAREERLARFREYRKRPWRRARRFVCLNNIPRPHRLALVSYLFSKGYDRQGYVSLLTAPNQVRLDEGRQAISALLPNCEPVLESLDRLLARIPVNADPVPGWSRADLGYREGGRQIYDDSYFSLVTDTNMPDRSFFRFTEKIFKPIANFQPFIVFGYHGELQLLKNEGFATSSPFLDESYDDVEDPAARFRAALSEFERLCALPWEALEAMILRLAPQMEENYARLWDAARVSYKTTSAHADLSSILFRQRPAATA
jgi:hypothetical protein